MKFECLINLLEEKGLVEVKRHKDSGITISIEFKSEYEEVINRIIDDLPEDAVAERTSKFELTITTFNDVYNWIKYHMGGKSKLHIKVERYFNYYERQVIVNVMKNLEEFEVSYDPWISEFIIIDIKMRDEKLRKEKEKHDKVVEFLNSLP